MNRVPITKRELILSAKEQFEFLVDYCKQYDVGNVKYATQIALKLRLLFHDRNNESLFEVLKNERFLSKSHFYDFRDYGRPHIEDEGKRDLFSSLMCGYKITPNAKSVETSATPIPKEPKRRNMFPWKTWWAECTVAHWRDTVLTRKDVVCLVANQAGGAHVAPTIDERLARITRNQIRTAQIEVSYDNGSKNVFVIDTKYALYAIVRTIAEETIQTLSSDIERLGK